jgi:hypothetical protein
MELEEIKLSDLSQIQCKFLHGESSNRRSILVVKFTGQYRDGSLGNPDAGFMNAMIIAALTAWEPSAAIIDLSQLKYVWGDMLEVVFPGDAGEIGDVHIPTVLIVGDECREAIRTLMFGVNSTKSLSEVEWVHESLNDAWADIERRLGTA